MTNITRVDFRAKRLIPPVRLVSGYDPLARVYLLNLSLWHAQCRLAAEYAAAVFGTQREESATPCDSEPPESA